MPSCEKDSNGLSLSFTGVFHSLAICHGLVAQDLAAWEKQPTVQLYHYIDDVMLMSDSLSDLEGAAPRLLQHLQEKRWAVNSTRDQGPGLSVKFLGVVWSGKTKVIPGAVIHKVQVFLLPTTVASLQVF